MWHIICSVDLLGKIWLNSIDNKIAVFPMLKHLRCNMLHKALDERIIVRQMFGQIDREI